LFPPPVGSAQSANQAIGASPVGEMAHESALGACFPPQAKTIASEIAPTGKSQRHNGRRFIFSAPVHGRPAVSDPQDTKE